ncbi:MAG: hypothetical protein IH598_15970 [Bacteroidales bacterium]|nr:hypothetical protein [Bacteroidales bacterium]
MDLQTRKLNIIEYLIGLKNDQLFNKIEAAIYQSKAEEDRSFKPFTAEELITRAKKSNADYNSGKVIKQTQLESESETW